MGNLSKWFHRYIEDVRTKKIDQEKIDWNKLPKIGTPCVRCKSSNTTLASQVREFNLSEDQPEHLFCNDCKCYFDEEYGFIGEDNG